MKPQDDQHMILASVLTQSLHSVTAALTVGNMCCCACPKWLSPFIL